MTEQNERDAAQDFQSPNPKGLSETRQEAQDRRVENAILRARYQMTEALKIANGQRRTAKAFEAEMRRLIASRSPEQVARMEREQGLS